MPTTRNKPARTTVITTADIDRTNRDILALYDAEHGQIVDDGPHIMTALKLVAARGISRPTAMKYLQGLEARGVVERVRLRSSRGHIVAAWRVK